MTATDGESFYATMRTGPVASRLPSKAGAMFAGVDGESGTTAATIARAAAIHCSKDKTDVASFFFFSLLDLCLRCVLLNSHVS